MFWLQRAGAFQKQHAQLFANRVGKRDVRHDAAPEERVLKAALGPIEKLIRQDDVARPVFVLERPNGADADDPGHAELLHGPEVRAVVQFARQDAMAAPVPGKKNDFASTKPAGQKLIGWRTKGCFHSHPFLVSESIDVIQPAAADDADSDRKSTRLNSSHGGISRMPSSA